MVRPLNIYLYDFTTNDIIENLISFPTSPSAGFNLEKIDEVIRPNADVNSKVKFSLSMELK